MKRLAIIWHSMTGGSKALAEAAASGATNASDVETLLLHADDASPQTLLEADGYIFAFPENLAAISGVMKAFFDGSNAVRQAERIATGWRLKRIADSLIVCTHAQTPKEILAPKTISEADLSTAGELGAAMAEGLALGIF
mgnify:CR=1 FL=1